MKGRTWPRVLGFVIVCVMLVAWSGPASLAWGGQAATSAATADSTNPVKIGI